MKLHTVPDRYIVQLPPEARPRDFGIESGPSALSMAKKKGRYVVRDMSDSQMEAIRRAGGKIFDNRPMGIPDGGAPRPLGAVVSGITRQTVNSRSTHGVDTLHAPRHSRHRHGPGRHRQRHRSPPRL